MGQEYAARLQHAEVLGDRLCLVLARQHGKHRLIDDDVERRVGERQRHGVALDHIDHIGKPVCLDIGTRLREGGGIHIEARDAAAMLLRQRDHRRAHVAGDLKDTRVNGKIHMGKEPLRRLTPAGTQARLAKTCKELMAHLVLLLFCHHNTSVGRL